MKILITGVDGYEGFALAQWIVATTDHTVVGIDNGSRRAWVYESKGASIIPIQTLDERQVHFSPDRLSLQMGDVIDYSEILELLEGVDVVVHLAEQPSAPYSMRDVYHANRTLANNIQGTNILLTAMREVCPKAHLIYVSTMGEYGIPGIPIPEGCFPDNSFWNWHDPNGNMIVNASLAGQSFPRCPGSVYHASKVASGVLVDMASRLWGLGATILYQGVVFGTKVGLADEQSTRFDVDEAFGTVLNRFCAQAMLNYPLTVYGKGQQTRGFISLENVCRSITQLIDLGPPEGVRDINQVDRLHSVTELADAVVFGADSLGIKAQIQSVPNPRIEAEEHAYEVDTSTMMDMGLTVHPLPLEILRIMEALQPHRHRLTKYRKAVAPKTRW